MSVWQTRWNGIAELFFKNLPKLDSLEYIYRDKTLLGKIERLDLTNDQLRPANRSFPPFGGPSSTQGLGKKKQAYNYKVYEPKQLSDTSSLGVNKTSTPMLSRRPHSKIINSKYEAEKIHVFFPEKFGNKSGGKYYLQLGRPLVETSGTVEGVRGPYCNEHGA